MEPLFINSNTVFENQICSAGLVYKHDEGLVPAPLSSLFRVTNIYLWYVNIAHVVPINLLQPIN